MRPKHTLRRSLAALVVLAGAALLVRTALYGMQTGLGWRQMVAPAGAGALMIALGLARWSFWSRPPAGRQKDRQWLTGSDPRLP